MERAYQHILIECFPVKGVRVIGGDLRLLNAIAGGAKASHKHVDREGRWFCNVVLTVGRVLNLCASLGWTFVAGYSVRSTHPFANAIQAKTDAMHPNCLLFRRATATVAEAVVAAVPKPIYVNAASVPEAAYSQYYPLKAPEPTSSRSQKGPAKLYRKKLRSAQGPFGDDDDDDDAEDEWSKHNDVDAALPQPTQVFGAHIRDLALTHYGVPLILAEMVDYLTTEDRLSQEGLFRLNASKVELTEVQNAIDRGERTSLADIVDVHVVTNLMKNFLKMLPEPLLPVSTLEFIEGLPSLPQSSERIQAISWMVTNYIPEPNMSALKHMMFYLGNVLKYTEQNRMTVQNLALVLGPNLIWMENDPLGSAALSNMRGISQLLQIMIENNEQVFSPAGSDDTNRYSVSSLDSQASPSEYSASSASNFGSYGGGTSLSRMGSNRSGGIYLDDDEEED